MDDQIGIAADRGSEVRIVLKRQTEVTDVIRVILGLRLRTQDDLVDQEAGRKLFGFLQDMVDLGWFRDTGFRQ